MNQPQGYEDIYGIDGIPMYWLRTIELIATLAATLTIGAVSLYINN